VELSYKITVPSKGLRERDYAHTYTHTHTQSFYGTMDFVQNDPGEPVPEETFTHSHLLWSSVIPYLLLSSITIHGILSVLFICAGQSFFTISTTTATVLQPPGLCP